MMVIHINTNEACHAYVCGGECVQIAIVVIHMGMIELCQIWMSHVAYDYVCVYWDDYNGHAYEYEWGVPHMCVFLRVIRSV